MVHVDVADGACDHKGSGDQQSSAILHYAFDITRSSGTTGYRAIINGQMDVLHLLHLGL